MADSIVWKIQREVISMKRRHAKEIERIRSEVIRFINKNIIYLTTIAYKPTILIGHESIISLNCK